METEQPQLLKFAREIEKDDQEDESWEARIFQGREMIKTVESLWEVK